MRSAEVSPALPSPPSPRSRPATDVKAARTAGWLLGHEDARGGPTSNRVPAASAW